MELQDFQDQANAITEQLSALIENALPSKGLTSDDCQQRALLNQVMKVEHLISGTNEEDLTINPVAGEDFYYAIISAGEYISVNNELNNDNDVDFTTNITECMIWSEQEAVKTELEAFSKKTNKPLAIDTVNCEDWDT